MIPDELSAATFASISAEELHTCGLLDGQGGQVEGTAKCWGLVDESLVGSNLAYVTHDVSQHVPLEEREPLSLLATDPGGLSAGVFNTCATTQAGGSVCWGLPATATAPPSPTPTLRSLLLPTPVIGLVRVATPTATPVSLSIAPVATEVPGTPIPAPQPTPTPAPLEPVVDEPGPPEPLTPFFLAMWLALLLLLLWLLWRWWRRRRRRQNGNRRT